MKAKAIVALVLLCLLSFGCAQDNDVLGPTNQVISGTFYGTDSSTLCKYCQINCYDVPVFRTGSCAAQYYTYGCNIKHTCFNIASINSFQFYTAIAFCAQYNKCKFIDVLHNNNNLGGITTDQFLELLQFRDPVLGWRKSVANLRNRVEQTDNVLFIRSKWPSLRTLPAFKSALGIDYERVKTYIDENINRAVSAATSKPFQSIAQQELKQLMILGDEDKRRKLREYILESMVPAIPPSVYMYYKFSQDERLHETGFFRFAIDPSLFPVWMSEKFQIYRLSTDDLASLRAQITKNNVRLERLVDWLNDFSIRYFKQYFDIYQEMLAAGAALDDKLISLRTKLNCAPGALEQGVSMQQCQGVNKVIENEQKLKAIEDQAQAEYTNLISTFMQEIGKTSVAMDGALKSWMAKFLFFDREVVVHDPNANAPKIKTKTPVTTSASPIPLTIKASSVEAVTKK